MGTIEKTVKQHSRPIDEETFSELMVIGERYCAVKNYVYSRYSGINSIHLLKDYRKLIRDEWVKTRFADQFKLQARYWKLALDEAISNIKSEWSNTKNRIRQAVAHNENLSEEERHYIYFVLTWDDIFQKILQYKTFEKPEGMPVIPPESEKRIHNLICRYMRRYKGKVAHTSNSRSFMIDAPMYAYHKIDSKTYIDIAGLAPRKRLLLPLTDNNIHKSNLRIVLDFDNRVVEIHRLKQVDTKTHNDYKNIIGVDKGYTSLFATSSDKEYGTEINKLLNEESDRLSEINKKRNKIHQQVKKLEKDGNFEKAQRIRENNLGQKKYNAKKARAEAEISSYINYGIRTMLKEEKPAAVICEDLKFNDWSKKLPKNIKRRLSSWCKGEIQERLEYICALEGVKVITVNPAYTSQVCHKCGTFGNRNGKNFTCPNCGKMDADINASHNIKQRTYDNDITLYTPHQKVKEILINRIHAVEPTAA